MTLEKLAKIAHVSISTVSKAFSASPEVSAETRRYIFDIAKEHGCFEKYYKEKYNKKQKFLNILFLNPKNLFCYMC